MTYLEREIQRLRDECDNLNINNVTGHVMLMGRMLEMVAALASKLAILEREKGE